MIDLFEKHAPKFEPISLDELNASAALLEREENKYTITTEKFFETIDELATNFKILTIDEKSVFHYKSTYFDTDTLLGYTYHNQGRTKRRFKIRTRHYVDSDLCFFEVKLKSKRGGTIKKRIPYAIKDYNRITAQAKRFMQDTYEKVYGQAFHHELGPKMEINYNRVTLVAKEGGERVTIDFNLSFEHGANKTPPKMFLIVETKSSNGKGIADAIFKQHGIKSRSCSKYCLGANLLDHPVKYNRFKPLLKFYNNLPAYGENATGTKRGALRPTLQPVLMSGKRPIRLSSLRLHKPASNTSIAASNPA